MHYAAPAISPDGKSIAAARTYKGLPAIYLMKADGSGLTRVVGDSDFNMAPAWSPDGQWLAFDHWTQGVPTPKGAIFVIKPDGTGFRRVTAETSPPGTGASWSPDGTQIAYWGVDGLHVINVDGTADTALRQGVAHPAWSPDGSQFAYDSTWSINVVNADMSHAIPIVSVTGTVQVAGPNWAPSGRLLVYSRVAGPPMRPQLFIVGVDGSDDHLLVGDGTESLSWARWSPL
jgi:TolB protein